MNDASDGELLKAFEARGDQGAFAELMSRHGRTALQAAVSVIGESSAAEDIVQATFMALARKASSLDGERSIAGWLYRCRSSKAVLALRSRWPDDGQGETGADAMWPNRRGALFIPSSL